MTIDLQIVNYFDIDIDDVYDDDILAGTGAMRKRAASRRRQLQDDSE